MITMPPILTNTCDTSGSSNWATTISAVTARKVPRQNICSECSPHLRIGSKTGHFRNRAFGRTARRTSQAKAMKMKKDALGDRMKENYERRTQTMLPRRTYTIVRVDGKAFHTFTRGCAKPYDEKLMAAMDATALFLCENLQGAKLGYVQSDEVSVLLTDFDKITTDAFFDGEVQKIVSVAASFATVAFNRAYGSDSACFDARCFTIPDPVEVANYFVWRQQDATRNSIQMAAQAKFPQKQLHGKNTDEMQEMLWSEYGINWSDYPGGCKRGRCIWPNTVIAPVEYLDRRSGETRQALEVERRIWIVEAPPVFTVDSMWLSKRIPLMENWRS